MLPLLTSTFKRPFNQLHEMGFFFFFLSPNLFPLQRTSLAGDEEEEGKKRRRGRSPAVLGLGFFLGEEAPGPPLRELHLLLPHVVVEGPDLVLPLVQLRRLPLPRRSGRLQNVITRERTRQRNAL